MLLPPFDIDSLFHSFDNQRIMVVGDIMLDRYITGRTVRMSPEAAVPILEFEVEENRLGGAANVALNLQALGAFPILCGVVGMDAEGQSLLDCMKEARLETAGIFVSPERISTVKTRMVAGKQQLMRLDREQTADLSAQETSQFLSQAIGLMDSQRIGSLILQDYNKGVLSPIVIGTLTREAKNRNVLITVDPKHRNFWEYKNVDLFKPNLKEVQDAFPNFVASDTAALETIARSIRERIQSAVTLITLSEKGVFLDDGYISQAFPTRSRTVADVCGAGDTVISIATMALSAGIAGPQLAMLANLAGGQVIEKTGVVPVDREQLRNELLQLFASLS